MIKIEGLTLNIYEKDSNTTSYSLNNLNLYNDVVLNLGIEDIKNEFIKYGITGNPYDLWNDDQLTFSTTLYFYMYNENSKQYEEVNQIYGELFPLSYVYSYINTKNLWILRGMDSNISFGDLYSLKYIIQYYWNDIPMTIGSNKMFMKVKVNVIKNLDFTEELPLLEFYMNIIYNKYMQERYTIEE